MDWLLDVLGKLVIWLVAALGAVLAWSLVRIHGLTERVAMLEQSVSKLPAAIEELKGLMESSRRDRETQVERVYDKLDDVRKELMDEIRERVKQ